MNKKRDLIELDALVDATEPELEEIAIAEGQAAEETPEVELVFDQPVASRWLEKASDRLREAYRSLRFEPDGMPERQINFLLYLAGSSVAKLYKVGKKYARGQFYVPVYLVEGAKIALPDLEEVGRIGNWVIFSRR